MLLESMILEYEIKLLSCCRNIRLYLFTTHSCFRSENFVVKTKIMTELTHSVTMVWIDSSLLIVPVNQALATPSNFSLLPSGITKAMELSTTVDEI